GALRAARGRPRARALDAARRPRGGPGGLPARRPRRDPARGVPGVAAPRARGDGRASSTSPVASAALDGILPLDRRPYDCFVSYAGEDAAAARAIVDWLGRAGLRVWFDQSRMGGG